MDSNEVARRSEAKMILRALLQGADPDTGRALHRSEVVHRPEVMRALLLGLEALTGNQEDMQQNFGSDRKRSASKTKGPERAGQGWGREEDEELRHLFGQRRPLKAIATELGRTSGAIAARLVRLGLINERKDARAGLNGAEETRL